MHGREFLDSGYSCYLLFVFTLLVNSDQKTTAQMTQVYQNQETAQTNLNKNITILRTFWVPRLATQQNKLTDTSQLNRIEMHVTVSTKAFKWTTATFPLVSLKQSVEIKNKEKDQPHLDVKVSATLLNNVTNVRSMNITIVSRVHPGLNIIKTQGSPMKLNYQLAWMYSGMKDFSVGYNATPSGTTKSIYRTNFTITDYQQRLLNEFYEPVNTFFCLNPIKVVDQKYEHGYNVVICLAGLIFAFLFMLFFELMKQHFQCNNVSFIHDNSVGYNEHLILTPTVQGTNYRYTSQHHYKVETSIVNVLTMDRVQIDREIVNRDLSSTERLEKEMEKAWCNGSSEIVISLVRKMENGKQITAELARKAISSFRSKIAQMEKELETFYQSKFFEIKKKISARNQKKIEELKANREKIINNAKKKNYRPEVIKMLEEEEDVKMQNAIAELQLSQREEMANLNKDIDSQRKVNYKDMQKDMLQLIRENSDMDIEREEWFMRENQKKQYEWSNQIEQNILQQQLALEEKLAKQEALVQQTDAQDLDHGELLDNIASQQISILKKFKKEKIIPPEEVKSFTEEFMNKLKTVKNEYDDKKKKEAKELNQKLNREKIASLDDIQAKNKLELEELEKKHKKEAQEGKGDPLDHMKEKQQLESQHRLALVEAESELDMKHAHQFQDMREKLMIETRKELNSLQNQLIDNMKEKGASDELIDSMIGIHRQAMNTFEEEQLQSQKKQNDLIQEALARKKEERNRKAEEEINSQKQIQKYEENLVKELLDNQIAMSENNRDKILEEHEKQMIKLDNSVMLNKIRQQQMLEKNLAKKREEKMRRLLEQQESEKSSRQPSSEDVAEVDDSKLIEKHAKERLAVMQESMNRSSAMEEIEAVLNRERAEALKQQEEKMGTLVAKMKLDKIKESCEIEEKERAIFKLKANLIDELQSNGNLEDSECSKMIDEHNQQRKAYRQQQEEERKKQEEILRENLQKQILKRQETMVQKNEEEIENVLEMNKHDDVASKLKRLVLKNKQMMEMEKLRNELTREMNQVMEETRDRHQLEIKQHLQEQELQLITHLIKLGKLKRPEMEKAMQMLLPGKSPDEIAELLNKIIQDDTDDAEPGKVNFTSSFELRVREVFLETKNETNRKERQRIKIKKQPVRYNTRADNSEEQNEDPDPKISNRLKPMSSRPMRIDVEADNDDGVYPNKEYRKLPSYKDQNYYYENEEASTSLPAINNPDIQMKRGGIKLPPVRLAPIEDILNTPRKKKKKKSELKNIFVDP